jgi:hypothetical protein
LLKVTIDALGKVRNLVERTRHEQVILLHPASLAGVDQQLEPGTYSVETIEEPIDGLSFLAYRRVSTTIDLPSRERGDACRQVVTIDPRALEAAKQTDAELANNPHDTAGATTRTDTADRTGSAGHVGRFSPAQKRNRDGSILVALDDRSARRPRGVWLPRRSYRGGLSVHGHAARGVTAISRRMELAIVATLLLCLSAILAAAEMPVGKVAPSAAKVPAKPSANQAAIRGQAVADCEGFWDRGTHMTKQEWSRTCRRVQSRLERLDVK